MVQKIAILPRAADSLTRLRGGANLARRMSPLLPVARASCDSSSWHFLENAGSRRSLGSLLGESASAAREGRRRWEVVRLARVLMWASSQTSDRCLLQTTAQGPPTTPCLWRKTSRGRLPTSRGNVGEGIQAPWFDAPKRRCAPAPKTGVSAPRAKKTPSPALRCSGRAAFSSHAVDAGRPGTASMRARRSKHGRVLARH